VQLAKLEADSVAAALKAGQSFDTLAKHHNDFRGGEETSILNPFPRAQLPPAYQAGMAGKGAKDIVVFPIVGNTVVPTKYVVAQIAAVEEGGELTLAEVKEKFRQRLSEEGGVRRLLDSLRKGTYVTIREDAIAVSQGGPTAAP
jgi:peptidyl-prolyl cis-trans isomerase SurA